MPIQKVYSGGRDNSLISFDVIDITSGTGYVKFYPVAASGANILSRTTQYNFIDDSIQTSSNGNLRGLNANINQNYDAKFNATLTIEGELTVSMNTLIRRITGGSASLFSSYAITISKWDGSTETQLATSTHSITATLDSGQATAKESCHNLTIPKTIFKKGDALRLKLGGLNNSPTWDTWMFIDSKNRSMTIGDTTPSFSICEVSVPFRLET